jgi:nicotinic acid phosphoribosyltransferase
MEDVVRVKIERGRKKLIRRYEGYLGIREDTGDPVEEYKEHGGQTRQEIRPRQGANK